ncbi:MAG: hypothetical protein ACHREM_10245 [Polyangiales bacterium]
MPTANVSPYPPCGRFRGSTVTGAFDHFELKYGRAAMHEVVQRLPREARVLVDPHAPRFGLLSTRMYPYAFIGQLLRAMIIVVKVTDEDAFLREIAAAGMDRTLSTVNRLIFTYMLTPARYAAHAQEIWSLYNDCGVVTVLPSKPNEYRVQVSDWPGHDAMVCRIVLEARRRSLEHMGALNTEVRRETCQGWGHDVCTQVFRWTSLDGKPLRSS